MCDKLKSLLRQRITIYEVKNLCIKVCFFKNVLGKIASPNNSQKLPRWFHLFQRGSFCELLGDAIFPSTLFKKQTLVMRTFRSKTLYWTYTELLIKVIYEKPAIYIT